MHSMIFSMADFSGMLIGGYAYDSYGRIIQSLYTIGRYNYTYVGDDTGKPTPQVKRLDLLPVNDSFYFEYTYDDNGNITSVYDGSHTTTYTYDSANQLVRENNQAANKTWVWTYNDAGNILSRKEYAYATGTLGTVQSTVNYTYGSITIACPGNTMQIWEVETIADMQVGQNS